MSSYDDDHKELSDKILEVLEGKSPHLCASVMSMILIAPCESSKEQFLEAVSKMWDIVKNAQNS